MEKIGVIQESCSDWASPPVLIRKKDGTIRWCIDYRRVNNVTVKDAFPLPSISQCLDQLSGMFYASTLDMASGYWQIELEESDCRKTAFMTRFGLYEFKRMPFGLCNAPATFQRVIQLVLRHLTWNQILAYLDDVIVLGKDFSDHLHNLELTFERFREHNLKLKPKKCGLFQREVKFLGKLVNSEGVALNPENVEKVKSWPIPKCCNDVEKFLGFVNYHREHIKDFAKIATVLYTRTGKRAKFFWGEEEQHAFDTLIQRMITAPVLAYPDPDKPFILDCDASGTAIGAELIQVHDGKERVISYGSFVLTPEQRKYCTTRLELLSVIRFTRQYRHYLLGRKFLVRTDHNSLTWLLRFKHIEGQLARWLEEISQFDMAVIHRPGLKHANADGMSRIPDEIPFCECYKAGSDPSTLPCGGCKFCSRAHQQWSRFEDDVDYVVPLTFRPAVIRQMSQTLTWFEGYSHEDLIEMQNKDNSINTLKVWILQDKEPTQAEVKLSSPATRSFWINKKFLKVKNDLLYYQWEEDWGYRLLLIVPDQLKEEVIRLNHDIKSGGHAGIKRTLSRVKQSFMWYGMTKDTELFVKTCKECNKNKKPNVKAKAALGVYHAGGRFERIHIDILGPFVPSDKGNQYVLMLVDQFTKWLECYPLPNQTAESVAEAVVDGFIAHYGCPLEIHTDQGRNFDGKLFAAVCELLQIAKTRTTPYRPCSNGQVERYNRTLLQAIRCFLKDKQGAWDQDLPQLAGAIRATVNRQTGFTANMMVFGQEVVQPVDLMLGTAEANKQETLPEDYVSNLRRRISIVNEYARQSLDTAQKRQKRDYDVRLKEAKFNVGDYVYQIDSATKVGQSSKLSAIWKGPYIVSKVYSPIIYKIEGERKTQSIVHHDRLKLCQDRVIPLWLRRKRSELLDTPVNEESDQDTDRHVFTQML